MATRKRRNLLTFFDEMGDPQRYYPHHQCAECGRITAGPGKEPEDTFAPPPKYPVQYKPGYEAPVPLYHIDEQGKGYTKDEAVKLGLPANISHGVCRNCWFKYRTTYGNEANKGVVERNMDDQKQDYEETLERVEYAWRNTLTRNEHSFNQTVNKTVDDMATDSQEVLPDVSDAGNNGEE